MPFKDAERNRAAVKADQAKRRAFIWEAKSKPCADCGIEYPPFVMDFDHVRGEKKFNLGRGPCRSWPAIKEEIAKCEVVCANCHRFRTQARLTELAYVSALEAGF